MRADEEYRLARIREIGFWVFLTVACFGMLLAVPLAAIFGAFDAR